MTRRLIGIQKGAMIPLKIGNTWEPIIKIGIGKYTCNAPFHLCANISSSLKNYMIYFVWMKCHLLKSHHVDSSTKNPLGIVDAVVIDLRMTTYAPIDFIIMDIESYSSCPIGKTIFKDCRCNV